jgi:glyoxylase-like metal-dependent hydrolase (beta-lactamase superfamily II)
VDTPAEDIGVLHVRGNIYMLVGKEANATAQVGEQGVLLVDTMTEAEGKQLLSAIQSLSDKPIRHIINTHAHSDHTGGNISVSLAGDGLFNRDASINVNSPQSDPVSGSAPIYAHENAMNAMSAMEPPVAFGAWPTSTYFTESKDLYFNGEAVRLFHEPNAHTDGDSVVQFRSSDVISTGDIFVTTGYPYIDVANGGSITGIIAALNHVIDIAVPEALQEGGTLIVPGRGRLCDESEVVEYRDMLTIILNSIRERMDEGMTLSEVQAVRPTFGFDARYGTDSDEWTTEQFVAAIYNELAEQRTN